MATPGWLAPLNSAEQLLADKLQNGPTMPENQLHQAMGEGLELITPGTNQAQLLRPKAATAQQLGTGKMLPPRRACRNTRTGCTTALPSSATQFAQSTQSAGACPTNVCGAAGGSGEAGSDCSWEHAWHGRSCWPRRSL